MVPIPGFWITDEVKFDVARQMFVDRMTIKRYPNLPVQEKKGRKEHGKEPG